MIGRQVLLEDEPLDKGVSEDADFIGGQELRVDKMQRGFPGFDHAFDVVVSEIEEEKEPPVPFELPPESAPASVPGLRRSRPERPMLFELCDLYRDTVVQDDEIIPVEVQDRLPGLVCDGNLDEPQRYRHLMLERSGEASADLEAKHGELRPRSQWRPNSRGKIRT